MSGSPHAAKPTADRIWGGFCAGVIVLVLAYFGWTATHGLLRLNTPGNDFQLLQLQVEAYQLGQTHLPVAPHPELLGLANPYDPESNRGVRLLDAALFRGRYYTYFGPAPLVLFLWPWYSVTGQHMPGDLLAWLLASGAFLFQAATLHLFAKTRDKSGGAMGGAALLTIGGANLLTPLLRGHGTFDIPVLSGLCFASIAFYFLLGFTLMRNRSGLRLAAASLALGLAIGSRPNLGPAVLALITVVALHLRQKTPVPRLRIWICALFPLAICLGALGTYNMVRFGRPWDFGNAYTLVEVDWTHREAFAIRYVPANLYYYFLSWPRLSQFFPFFLESQSPPFSLPGGYLGEYIERMAGIGPAYPVAGVGLFCLGWTVSRTAAGKSDPFAVGLAVYFLAVAVPLLAFIGSSVRYQAELIMPLCLAAALAMIFLGTSPASKAYHHLARGALVLLTLWSVAFNFAVNCASSDFFSRINPAGFKRIAHTANRIAESVWTPAGGVARVAQVELVLSAEQTGKLEPLLVLGRPPAADFIYLFHAQPGCLRIGFESMGRGGPVSDLIPVDYSRAHQLELILGAFLPPAPHPYFDRLGTAGLILRRMLRIKLDGAIVLDAVADFHPNLEREQWGESPDEPAFGRKFAGRLAVSTRPFDPAQDAPDWLQPALPPQAVLSITWPSPTPVRTEPLLAMGTGHRGQMVFARFLESGLVELGIRNHAGETILSSPFPVRAGATSELVVVAPALAPPSLHPGSGSAPAALTLDGRLLAEGALPACETGPAARSAGRNSLLWSGITERFTGHAVLHPLSGSR